MTLAAVQALESIGSAIDILDAHPFIGRRVDHRIREIVISRGAAGHIALYLFDPSYDVVRVLRVRHQREAGYRE